MTTIISNTTSSWRKYGMVWLVHPTSPTLRYKFKRIQCHGRHVSHTSQRWALWWRLTQKLCDRDFGCKVCKYRCSWGHERTHSSKYTSNSRLALSTTGEQKMFDETLDVCPHKKYTLTLIQMPASYALPSTSNPFEDFQKGVSPPCWTWCLRTTIRDWIGIILKEGQQCMLNQQLTSSEQSHKM